MLTVKSSSSYYLGDLVKVHYKTAESDQFIAVLRFDIKIILSFMHVHFIVTVRIMTVKSNLEQ